jgi:hypothetical protein
VTRNSITVFFLASFVLAASLLRADDGQWGKFIPPDYPWLQWTGRVEFHGKEARFDWAQVDLRVEFEGSACAIYLDPLKNQFNIFVDGQLKAIIGPKPKYHDHPDEALWISPLPSQTGTWVLSNLGLGHHLLEINKRTGPNFNVAKFYGLRLDAQARLLKPAPLPSRHLEFIGDSLTNAYGCEASSRQCKELSPFENSWKSYASISARDLNADQQIIALSGYGLVRNYGDKNPVSSDPMPNYYHRVISGDERPLWDASKFKPDAIIINLGNNDFYAPPFPDPERFQKGMSDLVDDALQGRSKIPVFIVSVLGIPIQDRSLTEAVRRAKLRGLDETLVQFSEPGDEEMGCSWHPNAAVHLRWAKTLERAMKAKLNW